MTLPAPDRLGATPRSDGSCSFTVWAPRVSTVEVVLLDGREHRLPTERDGLGYHRAVVEGVGPGTRYVFELDGARRRPDPASRLQPDGVHGPSVVVDPASWSWSDDGWAGRTMAECVLYELHVGTFTEAGTFAAVAADLPRLVDLGVTAIELMPVAAFPGERNWGYDGVSPFATHASYGGPEGLHRLVDAAHALGLAVVLDVVYNHLGPEGNYLADFGPYFSDAHRTPWGDAVNLDGADSDAVRRFFVENALWWVDDLHLDGLRLDAVDALVDGSAWPFVEQLGAAVHDRARALGRSVLVIAEDARNDPRLARPATAGGAGLDGQWADDFHHSLHVALTGETHGYYADYDGVGSLAAALDGRFVLAGQRSRHRRRVVGRPGDPPEAGRLVVFAQNHDQIGNRAGGERLATLVPPERLRLAAVATLLAAGVPLLFMGEEYGEPAPFLYFVDHGDEDVLRAVRQGRRHQLAEFGFEGDLPLPDEPASFTRSRLDRTRRAGWRASLYDLHRELLAVRRDLGAWGGPVRAEIHGDAVAVLRAASVVAVNPSPSHQTVPLPATGHGWDVLIDTDDERWGGPGRSRPAHLAAGVDAVALSPWAALVLGSRSRPAAT